MERDKMVANCVRDNDSILIFAGAIQRVFWGFNNLETKVEISDEVLAEMYAKIHKANDALFDLERYLEEKVGHGLNELDDIASEK